MFGTRQKKLALLLGATAGVWSMSATAVIDVDADHADGLGGVESPAMIQNEFNIGDGVTVIDVDSDMVATVKLGVGFVADDKIYVRFDLANGIFADEGLGIGGGVADGDLTAANLTDIAVALGGQVDDSFVIFTATVDGDVDMDEVLAISLGEAGIQVDDKDDVVMHFRVYDDLIDAQDNDVSEAIDIAGTDPTDPVKMATVIEWTNGIDFTFDDTVVRVSLSTPINGQLAGPLEAEVKEGYLNFGYDEGTFSPADFAQENVDGADLIDTVSIGSVTIWDTGARRPGEIEGGHKVFTGDSVLNLWGDFNLLSFLDAAGVTQYDATMIWLEDIECTVPPVANPGIAADTLTSGQATFPIDLETDFADGTTFDNTPGSGGGLKYNVCIQAKDAAPATINRSSYTAQFVGDVDDPDNYTAQTYETGSLGDIGRSGMAIQLPYLTDYSEYNQRIYIVNRNASAIDLVSFTFRPESGTTVTDLFDGLADKSVAGDETRVLLVRDVLTTSGTAGTGGTTRTPAEIFIDANEGTVDVATQQVNLADGTTDTVVYTDTDDTHTRNR